MRQGLEALKGLFQRYAFWFSYYFPPTEISPARVCEAPTQTLQTN
jgi:hypothetical protein